MSSELVRQALAFVDPDESMVKPKKNKKGKNTQIDIDSVCPFKNRNKKKKNKNMRLKEDITEENIKKLLILSTPSNIGTVDKIIERAIKGKPLLEKIELKVEEEKSILFPEESFKDFEKTYFCS